MIGEQSLTKRILVTLGILLLMLAAGRIPIPWVDLSDSPQAASMQGYMMAALGSDAHAIRFLSLGLTPYISASILMMLARSMGRRRRSLQAPPEMKKKTYLLAAAIAAAESPFVIAGITYRPFLGLTRGALEGMTAGGLLLGFGLMILCVHLTDRSGIGGASVLIMGNALQGLTGTLTGALSGSQLLARGWLAYLLFVVITVFLTVLLDRTELRLPLIRISINSSYASEAYLALRFHPAGIMPAMYAMALYALPGYLMQQLGSSKSAFLQHLAALWDGGLPAGLLLLFLLIWFLTFALSRIMVDPAGLAESLQESGDYLEGVHPGAPTRLHIQRRLNGLCLISALGTCLLIGVGPALIALRPEDAPVYMSVTTWMLLTGIFTRLAETIRTEWQLQRYRPFWQEGGLS